MAHRFNFNFLLLLGAHLGGGFSDKNAFEMGYSFICSTQLVDALSYESSKGYANDAHNNAFIYERLRMFQGFIGI